MRFWGLVTSFACAFAASATAAPLAISHQAAALPSSRPIVPVVVFGDDARRLPEIYAQEHQFDRAEVVRAHTASGLIRCGNAHGAGQLTLSDDVVTTAAHVFYDENGQPRARTCTFSVVEDGHDVQVPIDLSSILAGSTRPYDVEVAHDWAVARLAHALVGVRPYGIASDIHANESVTFVARGHIDWGGAKKLSMQACTFHDNLSRGTEGTREFSFDCDTGDGASGGAVMFDHESSRIGAILVGWRSNRPFAAQPFSSTHYNFAVTLEGGFRDAVYALAGKVISQK